jgi:hypothetical protein
MKKTLLSFTAYITLCTINAQKPFLPATLAFLKKPSSITGVRRVYGKAIDSHKNSLIRPLLIQEALHPNHIFLYHGQTERLTIVTDFLHRLYSKKYKKPLRADFYLLRHLSDGADDSDAQAFLDRLSGEIEDHLPEIRSILLSVNLSYFGNLNSSGEATFSYVLNNQSCKYTHNQEIYSIFKHIFDKENLCTKYIDELIDLSNEYRAPIGNTYQIILTPEAADKYVYLCNPGGRPCEKIYDINNNVVAAEDFCPVKNRYIRCLRLFDRYYTNPESIKHIDSLQARLLLNKNYILNPNSGVKILRYTGLTYEQEQAYQAKLDALCTKIFQAKQ